MDSSTPGFPVLHSLPVCSNSCLLRRWYHPTISSFAAPFSFCPQSFLASGSFPESALSIRWPEYWSFNFNIGPSNECSGLISISIDWFDLLAVQGTLKTLIQHHFSTASILQHSAFFVIQFSHLYMTTGKTIGLTIPTFIPTFWLSHFSKVLSLPFNMLSRFVIAFLPINKHLFIAWLQSPSTVILEPKQIQITVLGCNQVLVLHEVDRH